MKIPALKFIQLLLISFLFSSNWLIASSEKERSYTVFSKLPFEYSDYFTKPKEEEISDSIKIVASPGEYEPATFLVYAKENLKGVEIEASDLVGKDAIISKNNVDVKVVKVWYQAGQTGLKDGRVLVPELLLKDDSIIMADFKKEINVLNFNDVPDGSDFLKPIDIPKDTTRQFWITVKVPNETKPGLYKSLLRIRPKDDIEDYLELQVDVLPIILEDPDKIYSIYYNKSFTNGIERYKAELKDIKEHGLTGTSIYEGVKVDENGIFDFDGIQVALALRKYYGLTRGNIFLGFHWDTPLTHQIYRKNGINQDDMNTLGTLIDYLEEMRVKQSYPQMWYYGIDEPYTDDKLERCKEIFKILKSRGTKTTTAIPKRQADKLGGLIDMPIYSLPSATAILLHKEKKDPNKLELFYWHPLENPVVDRFNFGLFLWISGLDGVVPYAYQGWGGFGTKTPYDDFGGKRYRPEMYTYPTKTGVIPTIQWEAAREGIDDMRYLTTLKKLLDSAENLDGAKTLSTYIDEMNEAESVLKNIPQIFLQEPKYIYDNAKVKDFYDLRIKIIKAILSLQQIQ
jgi:hypothetical protein